MTLILSDAVEHAHVLAYFDIQGNGDLKEVSQNSCLLGMWDMCSGRRISKSGIIALRS